MEVYTNFPGNVYCIWNYVIPLKKKTCITCPRRNESITTSLFALWNHSIRVWIIFFPQCIVFQ